ncbi:polymorphic toxin-type HINT domain-containing protein [Streptomyces sp. ST2-7A]|uniref:polymorphic toxin-type HINT domain-containing protein n=1 Tax=Streptomyces sp. ST2-7A TaxID=2907214 RepID=UPI001F3A0C6D|nr:polymorphic toxin-type HINT domain-containing protein [Streptomyces sp. ST2-7A]MCE7079203.1 sugar-binding protein [Streptomyces sp. ST2-7A]
MVVPVVTAVTLLQGAPTRVATADDGAPEAPEVGLPVEGRDGLPVKSRGTEIPEPVVVPEPESFPAGEARVIARPEGLLEAAPTVENLPVSVTTPGQVPVPLDIEVVEPERAEALGANGPVVVLRPVDEQNNKGATAPLRVTEDPAVDVTIDYSDIAHAFGGGFGSRLSLIGLPECSLITPEKEGCEEALDIEWENDTERETLIASNISPAGSGGIVLAAVSSADGEKGSYGATDLSPSATWETNLNTGDFTWSHDMPVPDVPGGLKPRVGLTYSSGSIDGRTGGTNNQGSWVGDGFDLWPGYIERRYKPCGYDEIENTDGNKIGDLCWDHDNAFVSFNGAAGELVPAGSNTWKLPTDDGTRIERLTDSARANGDNDNEYWRLTDPDGTQYYFGYHRLPGWSSGREVTDSTWTVPVFGNDPGDPCHTSAIKDAWCQQAWRWNLDYVVDVRGNAVAYHYNREQNSYGRFLDEKNNTRYTRGGTLKRIDYGLNHGTVYTVEPRARVVFTNEERCIPGPGVDCSDITKNAFHWYDTPWDLNCDAGKNCDAGRFAPSFWTTKRLTAVTTRFRTGTSTWNTVDSWKLAQHWGTADVDYQLLLSSVQRTGHSASAPITLPKTTFGYTQLANRRDVIGDGWAPFIKARLSTVADEVGGQIDVNYSAPGCSSGSLPTPHTNTTRCFPQFLAGGPDHDPDLQWFNKYVVTAVTATDRTGGSPDQVTRYDYRGGAAWHYDESGLLPEEEKTWSQWRGYGEVRQLTGAQGTGGMVSRTDSYFLRGMHGDRAGPSGGTKSVSVTLGSGEGDPIVDHSSLAGFPYKTVVHKDASGGALEKTISRPWYHRTARSVRDWGTIAAHFIGAEHTRTFTSLDDGAGGKWRITEQHVTHDTVAGRVTQVDDRGDTSTSDDDRCVRTTWATNTAKNLLGLQEREEVVAARCAATPDRSEGVLSDVRYAYDGGAYGATPTLGEVTGTATLKEHDGTKATYLEAGAEYDTHGRIVATTDISATVTVTGGGTPQRTPRTDGRTTRTVYTPATGPATRATETGPPARSGVASSALTTVTELDPVRGLPTRLTDPNSRVTVLEYDALGRTTKVWLPNRRTTQLPSHEFAYRILDGQAVAVSSKSLNNAGSGQDTAYTLYDGFLRERQTQVPGPDGGRLLTDTFHDERGLVTKTFAPYFADGKPAASLFLPTDASTVESQTRHVYDGAGREIESRLMAGDGDGGKTLAVTTTIHRGDRTTVIPPEGGTTTTTLLDARERLIELRRHHGAGAGSAYDALSYSWTPRGQLASVTDPADNTWSYTWDQRGNNLTTTDPDTGTTTQTWDDRGNLTSTTNSLGETLSYVHDNLNRRTELREDGPTGTLRAEWEYDSLFGGKGQLRKSTRWEDGHPYVQEVLEHDPLYRPVRARTLIPSAEGPLAGNYATTTAYNASGTVRSTTLPAAGSLAGEAVTYTYEDATLRPVGLATNTGLATTTVYNRLGRPLQHEIRGSGRPTWLTNTYEHGTQRLATTRVDREGRPGVDRHETYAYDPIGNVLSIEDVSRSGTDLQCFDYDHLRRLTDAWTQNQGKCAGSGAEATIAGPAPYHHSYAYDTVGNRVTETLHERNITRTHEYGAEQPHTLTSVVQEAPGVTSLEEYGYDAAGQTVSRQIGGDTQTLTWTPEGRVDTVENHDETGASYLYSADGGRLIARTDTGTTLHLGHTDITLPTGATKPEATRYIDLGSGHMAVTTDDGATSVIVADHHGTGHLAINTATGELTQRRTLPFGGLRGTDPGLDWPGTRSFVGGIDDTESTGLINLGAREYDPAIGRFISPDPIMDLTDSQQIHGYTYANNNPLAFSDPSGLFLNKITALASLNKVAAAAIGVAKVMLNAARWILFPTTRVANNRPIIRMTGQGGQVRRGVGAFFGKAEGAISSVTGTYGKIYGDALGCVTGNGGCKESIKTQWSFHPVNPEFWKGVVGGAKESIDQGVDDFREGRYAEMSGEAAFDIFAALAFRRTGPSKPREKASCSNSFVPGTHVLMADGTTKAIEDVAIGDPVLASDPETGEVSARTVTAEIQGEGEKELVAVGVSSTTHAATPEALSGEPLVATANHPFWVDNTLAWTEAGELAPGDLLVSQSGALVPVTSLSQTAEYARVHNLTVEGPHTYYVLAGETPVLVHNVGGARGPKDPLNFGSNYTGRVDRFDIGGTTDFEIHVYHKGKEVGIFGSDGWFSKHGKSADVDVPRDVYNNLKGLAVGELRRDGRIGDKGTENVKGDNWKRPRITGGGC